VASGRRRGFPATRRLNLDLWIKTLPQRGGAAMEATICTGWIYDTSSRMQTALKEHTLMAWRAIAAARKRTPLGSPAAGARFWCYAIAGDFLGVGYWPRRDRERRALTLRYSVHLLVPAPGCQMKIKISIRCADDKHACDFFYKHGSDMATKQRLFSGNCCAVLLSPDHRMRLRALAAHYARRVVAATINKSAWCAHCELVFVALMRSAVEGVDDLSRSVGLPIRRPLTSRWSLTLRDRSATLLFFASYQIRHSSCPMRRVAASRDPQYIVQRTRSPPLAAQ